MLPEMGHSNTTEASRSYLYKNDAFFFVVGFLFCFFLFLFLVNWVSVRIKKKKVCDCINKRALKTSKT